MAPFVLILGIIAITGETGEEVSHYGETVDIIAQVIGDVVKESDEYNG